MDVKWQQRLIKLSLANAIEGMPAWELFRDQASRLQKEFDIYLKKVKKKTKKKTKKKVKKKR